MRNIRNPAVIVLLFFAIVILAPGVAHAYGWGDDWKVSSSSKCKKCGKWFKHVGLDLPANKKQSVYFNRDGWVKKICKDDDWKYGVVIETPSGDRTYVIWHLEKPVVKEGDYLGSNYGTRSNKLGKVADMGSNTHVHLGQREKGYNKSMSPKGAVAGCDHKPKASDGTPLPRFPEYFVYPITSVITIK